jgi:hypothetical protein
MLATLFFSLTSKTTANSQGSAGLLKETSEILYCELILQIDQKKQQQQPVRSFERMGYF